MVIVVVFLKRFKPGDELPTDFSVTHSLIVTPDGRYIYADSYASNYIIKIDTQQDQVVKVFNKSDHGLMMSHAGFISGTIR